MKLSKVAKDIPQEQVKPAGKRASVRERVRQFEVEVPPADPGDRQNGDGESEAPNRRRKQESDPDPHVSMDFSLCDGSSDQGAELADDSNELETCRRPREESEGVPDEKLDDIMLEMRDVKSELLRVRALLGVLVRRERYAETKMEIAARRLDRMERAQDEVDDAEHEADLARTRPTS